MDETLRIPYTGRARTGLVERVLRDSAYSLAALPIGIATFTIAVTGLSAGLGLVIVWVGLPVLVGTLLALRGFAHLERLRMRTLLGLDVAPGAYRRAAPDDPAGRRLLLPLRDAQSWLDALWGIVGFVTGLVSFVFTVTWWAVAGGGLTFWFWQHWLPDESESTSLPELLGLGEGRGTEIWFNLLVGAFALLTLPVVMRAVAALHATPARLMLDREYRRGLAA